MGFDWVLKYDQEKSWREREKTIQFVIGTMDQTKTEEDDDD